MTRLIYSFKMNLKQASNEPPHDKTNKMICALSEDFDQPGHPPNLIRVLVVRMKKLGSLATHWVLSEDSYQTGRMPRMIWVFTGHTCHFVGFVMRPLKCGIIFYLSSQFWNHWGKRTSWEQFFSCFHCLINQLGNSWTYELCAMTIVLIACVCECTDHFIQIFIFVHMMFPFKCIFIGKSDVVCFENHLLRNLPFSHA